MSARSTQCARGVPRPGDALRFSINAVIAGAMLAGMLLGAAPVHAEMSAEELAKLAQNPVGNLISLPFQNNTNLNFGPEKGTQNILNIQPVIPISVSDDWNVITRTILPVIWNPSLGPGDSTSGIGDTVFTAFLSPANPGSGSGARAPSSSSRRTATRSSATRTGVWGPRPSCSTSTTASPWVYGVLVNNIWSLSSSQRGGSYNNGLIQPFVNYNFEGGLYLTSAPILTVDWKADGSQQWTVPVGGGVGKIFHLGKLPVNTQLSAYYNVVRPDRRQLADPGAGAAHVPEMKLLQVEISK